MEKIKQTSKAKGFTLDGVTSQFINFLSMELLVQRGMNELVNKKSETTKRFITRRFR